jgi:hypothetical protein
MLRGLGHVESIQAGRVDQPSMVTATPHVGWGSMRIA